MIIKIIIKIIKTVQIQQQLRWCQLHHDSPTFRSNCTIVPCATLRSAGSPTCHTTTSKTQTLMHAYHYHKHKHHCTHTTTTLHHTATQRHTWRAPTANDDRRLLGLMKSLMSSPCHDNA
jgi:hypothetical protein